MKSYVSQTLMPNETVLYHAKIHWAVYISSVCCFAISTLSAMTWLITRDDMYGAIMSISLIATFAAWLAAFIERNTTEMAITNRRVVAKFGLIRRQTYEPQLAQTEGACLEQDILGRVLGYGKVKVSGKGGMVAPIPFVENPVMFRNELAKAIERHEELMGKIGRIENNSLTPPIKTPIISAQDKQQTGNP